MISLVRDGLVIDLKCSHEMLPLVLSLRWQIVHSFASNFVHSFACTAITLTLTRRHFYGVVNSIVNL
jgi:hypothetical protein